MPRSLLSTLSLVGLVSVPLSACLIVVGEDDWSWDDSFTNHCTYGSGVRAETTRETADFHAIELALAADVTVRVGEPTSIRLSGDDNILPDVTTEVSDGVLVIELEGNYSFQNDLALSISTPGLDRFTIEGSGDIDIQGVAAERLALEIEGSGSIRAQGNARKLDASIAGSGEMVLTELSVDEAELSIDGSGSMCVRVDQGLRYSIEGSGDIRYAGDPDLQGDVEGSGSVSRIP